MAMNQISYGEVFLDVSNCLVDFNFAVQQLPGLPGKIEIRQSASQALGSWWDQISTMIGPDPVTKEVIHQTDSGQMFFLVKSIPLLHPDGRRVGQVFGFEDITHLRQAQRPQGQTDWVQATLQERQQLGGELHDRLSQSLACLNIQAQTAQLYLQSGLSQDAQECLSRLILEIEEVQQETRALISSLLSGSSSVDNFWEAMRHLLEDFRQQTGLTILLKVGEEDVSASDEFVFDPAQLPAPAAMQLIRITQEALTNARRHAKSVSQVTVQFIAGHKQMFLVIEDDGEGFDPSNVSNDGQHFGLKIMRQRAERVGGQTFINSKPGKGTRIEVCLPLVTN